ncbi:MAG TPA: FtsX-like permease family protein [Candidatus Saccharimonadales bacterium]|nr:FtsX-like permease family protein [Candidatus Saccharimonadales bacterium]
MIAFLAARNLVRSRTRTLLLWLGISVSGALLYDMVMLAGGLAASFEAAVRDMSFELRLAPRGVLPFTADAALRDGSRVLAVVRSDPRVARALGFYGTTLYWRRPGSAGPLRAAFVMACAEPAPEVFRVAAGRLDAAAVRGGVLINRHLARAAGVGVGDTLEIAAPPDAQVQRQAREVRLPVAAVGDFRFDTATQNSCMLPTELAQALRGVRAEDPLSLVTVRLRRPADAPAVARDLRARLPQAEVYQVQDLVRKVRAQLSYFTQFSAILGALSFAVAWLLISTLLVLSLNDRLGEMAVLGAIGLRPARLVALMLTESLAFVAIGVPSGLLLGLATARYLDRLLLRGPGLPADLHFFVATPAATAETVALLALAGALGALGPMRRVARLPIAATLHEAAP